MTKRILAIDPVSSGVGFAVLEGPDELIDWGIKHTKKADNERVARAIEALINQFRPDILAIEDWNSVGSRRCDRVQTLLDRIARVDPKRVRVCLISIKRVRAIVPPDQKNTKYTRARYIAERFPELAVFLPPVRKIWMREDIRMAIFDAVGFALACLPIRPRERKPNSSSGAEGQVGRSRH